MNLNKIFDLFNENPQDKDEDVSIVNLYEHPLFWVGMFEKLIKNNDIFKNKINKFFFIDNPDYDFDELNKLGDNVVFNRAYIFIKQIDLNNPDHQKAVIARGKHGLSSIISLAINYFSILEEYEKCIVLKNIQTFLEKNLAL